MDLQSYIQLKEAYKSLYSPEVEVTTEEVDSFIDALLEEGYDLSEFTWDEVREAYLEEGRLNGQQRAAARAERQATKQAERAKSQAEFDAGGGKAGVAQRTGGSQGGSRARQGVKARRDAESAVRE